MKTDKIARLISALGNPSSPQVKPQEEKAQEAARQTAQPNSDAVRLASGFGQSMGEVEEPGRTERVQHIRAQVQSGEYNPKSRDVAASLIRDLGI